MNPGGVNPNQAPSFKTNVNRMKTKRWVDAKSYTYDGDDWGEADDYNEYDGYDDPQTSQVPQKPTGLRQAGPSTGVGGAPPYNTNRAVSQTQPPYGQTSRDRANSFGRGDDRRAFSGPGGPPPPIQEPPVAISPRRTAYGQPQGEGPPGQRPMGPGQGRPPQYMQQSGPQYGQQPPPFNQHPGQQWSRPSLESQGRSSSFENRGPYMRGPSPHGRPSGGPPVTRPRGPSDAGRTSSLTSNNSDRPGRRDMYGPGPQGMGGPQPLPPGTRPPRKSSLSQHDQNSQQSTLIPAPAELPAESDLQASEDDQAPPATFVRPADIYRRMQEERQRERTSQDSGRPSMEGLIGNKSQVQDQPSSAAEVVPRRRSPVLDTVAERKSEYGMEGLLKPESKPVAAPAPTSGNSLLPDFSTGFGDGLGSDWSSSFISDTSGQQTSSAKATNLKSEENEPELKPPTKQASLSPSPEQQKGIHREPSIGLTSAVHHAFDQSAVPGTPSSESGSRLGRSDSETTSMISPIISRGPSAATAEQKTREAEVREKQIPPIQEEPSSTPRNRSVDLSNIPVGEDDPPPGFVSGHRRNMSTPSPDNSPARTPALEVTKTLTLRNPQEVEIAESTPTPSSAAHSNSTASNASKFGDKPQSAAQVPTTAPILEPSQQTSIPNSRSNSPSKGRVRELADKINSTPSSRRGSVESWERGSEDGDRSPTKPDDFRPSIPGGWNSYTTNDGSLPSKEQTQPEVQTRSDKTEEKPQSDITKTAFAATAAAGAALASAVVAAAGGQTENTSATQKSSTGSIEPDSQPESSLAPRHEQSSSSIMPTPSGMGDGHDLSKDREYFPQVPPLKTKSQDTLGHDLPRTSTPPRRIPTMSTDPSPSDQDSDRLRKQLIRDLSPQPEESTSQNNQPSMTNDSLLSAESLKEKEARPESSFLPSEYESYWNTSTEEDENQSANQKTSMHSYNPSQDTKVDNTPSTLPTGLPASVKPGQPGFVAPHQHTEHSGSLVPDQDLRRKFSWEMESESVPAAPKPAPIVPPAYSTTVSPPAHPQAFEMEGSPAPSPQLPQLNSIPPVSEQSPVFPDEKSSSVDNRLDSEPRASLSADSPEVASQQPRISELSAIEPVPTSGSADSQTGSNNTPELGTSISAARQSEDLPKPGQLRIPPKADTELRALAFKEILALKTSEERIKMFNQTSTQYSNHHVGLDRWVASTINGLPEHKDLVTKHGSMGAGGNMPMRVAPGTSQQQPYYQQYLSASNTGASTGTGASSISPSAGGKLTSHQVQAKGKDLLKGAGVLGGKANVAAKGLFAKGRKRFGGGDKAIFRKPSASTSQKSTPDITPSKTAQVTSPKGGWAPLLSNKDPQPQIHSRPLIPDESLPKPSIEGFPAPPRTISSQSNIRAHTPPMVAKERVPPKTPPGPWKLFPTQQTGRASPAFSHHSNNSLDRKPPELKPKDYKPENNEDHVKQRKTSRDSPQLDIGRSRSASNASNSSNLAFDVGTVGGALFEEPAVPVGPPVTQRDVVVDRQEQEQRNFVRPLDLSPVLEDSPTMGFTQPSIILDSPRLFKKDGIDDETPTQADFPPSNSDQMPPPPPPKDSAKSHPESPPKESKQTRSDGPSQVTEEDHSEHKPGAVSDDAARKEILPEMPQRRSAALSVAASPTTPTTPKPDSEALETSTSRRRSIASALDSPLDTSKKAAVSTRSGPSLLTDSQILTSEAGAMFKSKHSPVKPPGCSRPFSWIEFGEIGTTDLSLVNPATPESEHKSRYPDTVSEESGSYVEDERGIMAEKDIESNPSREDQVEQRAKRNSNRASSGIFEEPPMQSHPALKYSDTDHFQQSPKSFRQPAQSIYSAYNPQSPTNYHRRTMSGYSGFSGYSSGEHEQPMAFPPRTTSRPQIISRPSQNSTHSSSGEKKGRRRSMFSTISGQSDTSRRFSRNLEHTISMESQQQPPSSTGLRTQQTTARQPAGQTQHQSPFNDRFGIEQSAYDPRDPANGSPPPAKLKGHRRILSGSKLLSNIGIGGSKSFQTPAKSQDQSFSSQSQAQESTPPNTASASKPMKGKRPRLPSISGLFSRPAQKHPTPGKDPQQVFLQGLPTQNQSAYQDTSLQSQQYRQGLQPSYQSQGFNEHSYDPSTGQFAAHQRQISQGSMQQTGTMRPQQPASPRGQMPSSARTGAADTRGVDTAHAPARSQPSDSIPLLAEYVAEPLDGFYNPERSQILHPDIPQNPAKVQAQKPHSRQTSQPLSLHSSPPTSHTQRRVSSQTTSAEEGNAVGERHGANTPPPPPPKDAPKSGSPNARRVTRHGKYTSVSTIQTTISDTSTIMTSASVPLVFDPMPGPPLPQLPHILNHKNSHAEAHDKALRQTLPPLQTTTLQAPVKQAENKSAPPAITESEPVGRVNQDKGKQRQLDSPTQNLSGGPDSSTPIGEGKYKQAIGEAEIVPIKEEKTEEKSTTTSKKNDQSDEDVVVMSSTAYPGQEWRPDFLWDGN